MYKEEAPTQFKAASTHLVLTREMGRQAPPRLPGIAQADRHPILSLVLKHLQFFFFLTPNDVSNDRYTK